MYLINLEVNYLIRRISILTILLVISLITFGQVKKVLFIGNSYTGVNNLPEKVSKLASSLGDSISYDSSTPGGFRLMDHATYQGTLNKISQEKWDFVVIQAQSQEPSFPPEQVIADVLPYAVILNDSIKSNYGCSETVFYMTWGRKNGDMQNCPTWPPVCTYLGMQERLVAGYMSMAEQNGSTIAPVGLAWKNSIDNDPQNLIELYAGDGSHPSLSGTYLTACVMYATIYDASPVGAEYIAGLPEDVALFLQQMAEEVVHGEEYNFYFNDTTTNIVYDLGWEDWYNFGNINLAGFSFTNIESTFSFTDNSLNSVDYMWDFGDGNTSTLQNPVHSFTESGSFIVKQSTSNTCFTDSAYDTINAVISDLPEMRTSYKVNIYPNPSTGVIDFNVVSNSPNDYLTYDIIDLNGKILRKGKISGTSGKFNFSEDLSNIDPGNYFLKINGQTKSKKIVIN